jgi:dipeptidyl aminopeptidase/acylaminoacyl peptidase
MERALRRSGVAVETLYYETEGHGFYRPEHRQAYYRQLLGFLGRNIGTPTAE